ncbi:M48 family metallopeptidase [Methanocella arvoryzae]|uniref:Predicted peptidase (M48 family) n=1 Tax=Methanocella arvoryzae (strain DSM 22066 / NBRC 105507 / MRE50) TaxID=351160 RepID=Q0W248_METAR|nr:M48 family metallopeptidase [Methanocella arvoryzae]CAJ37545.1 predicted peptidase (M48 family) [Methanocella arvoryzae MRE50]
MAAAGADTERRQIDFRAEGEVGEYFKKLVFPAIIVLLLILLLGYAGWTYGFRFLIPRLMASSFFIAGMLIGAVLQLILLIIFTRWRFYNHVLSRSIRANEKTLQEIDRIAREAADRLAMRPPGVYVVQDPQINAYALGFRRKVIVLNTGLIDVTSDDELKFIIGHELAHVKYGWSVPVKIFGLTIKLPLLLSSQHREYTCDRGGLIACRNLNAAILVLARLALGKRLADKVDIESMYKDKDEVERDRMSKISEFIATHPPIKNRVYQLRQFHESELYHKLIR